MLFAVDIDRTIAIDTNAYATCIAQALELHIPEKTLQQVKDFWEFVRLPEISTYRADSQDHEARFQTAYEEAKASLEVLTALQAIPFAAKGVYSLTQYGQAGYYTSRLENMHEVTKAWLRQYQFPELPIVSCKNFLIKYLMCYMHTKESGEPVVLIDDNAEKLIAVWERVLEKWPIIGERLPQRFILVAFGCDSVLSHTMPFPVLNLSSWESENVQLLLNVVVRQFSSTSVVTMSKEEIVHDQHNTPL